MSQTTQKKRRAPRNRTLEVYEKEIAGLRRSIVYPGKKITSKSMTNRVICADSFSILPNIAKSSVDLLFADPPYNLTKAFGKESFNARSSDEYETWLTTWLTLCVPLLKTSASIYICGDWRSSAAIQRAGSRFFKLRNRITWEREKGRGAAANWKNSAEDIWFFTMSDNFTFDLAAVKVRRRVLAPYKENGRPKDWDSTSTGNFRDTHPSNMWTDISVPFWSMPENTDHPTQKPEKLLAKIILASSLPGDLILDPFSGSGTTAVAAQKLGRNFIAIESDEKYCLLAQKRLTIAETDRSIQGYDDGVFWERNARLPR